MTHKTLTVLYLEHMLMCSPGPHTKLLHPIGQLRFVLRYTEIDMVDLLPHQQVDHPNSLLHISNYIIGHESF